ncbi:hypothetical protein [Sphingopyxis sp. 113P3]|uniref:hypothetical protein n=1 Tax=Sphingopyxis sp. (strain 113P3) TaxID=292913 RepID=UPI0006AD2E76|nr:hypothetical protein [Sphingopyxis sp. 113P3]ALC10739.1 hypothetical protein LH20_02115 [Sphingopyxis sp. 113P3]
MDDDSEKSWRDGAYALARALRPAVPAVIGAAALTFLFAAVMPLAWVAAISWNLYLDRLSALFEPPVGNGGRLALALGMAAVAAVIAALAALALAKPEALRLRRARVGDDPEEAPRRRRADVHPDDPPRPPLRAGRDLPPQGLGPVTAMPLAEPSREAGTRGAADGALVSAAADTAARIESGEEELVLADLAPAEAVPGEEPWLQPAEMSAEVVIPSASAMPDPADQSLGAMVARFEAGLARRREARLAGRTAADAPESEDEGETVDFALEAALGTLQRLNRLAVG